jgi:predicted site-specific integrase-resolvase
MTAEETKVSREGRYSVAQTCLALGISRNTLRKYTDEGYIKCGYRRGTCRKFYSGNEIRRFWNAIL